jgi:putative SOS response-associated peptidase YedK
MPAILSTPSEIELWLSGEPWSERLKALIRPFEEELECYAVDRGVGKVQNDSEDFVKVRTPPAGLCFLQISALFRLGG